MRYSGLTFTSLRRIARNSLLALHSRYCFIVSQHCPLLLRAYLAVLPLLHSRIWFYTSYISGTVHERRGTRSFWKLRDEGKIWDVRLKIRPCIIFYFLSINNLFLAPRRFCHTCMTFQTDQTLNSAYFLMAPYSWSEISAPYSPCRNYGNKHHVWNSGLQNGASPLT
jgi:hypothetical protein